MKIEHGQAGPSARLSMLGSIFPSYWVCDRVTRNAIFFMQLLGNYKMPKLETWHTGSVW